MKIKSSRGRMTPDNTVDTEKPFKQMWKNAPSLTPDLSMMTGCILGIPESLAIRDIWQFRTKITVMSREAFEAITERSTVVFGG